MVDIESCLQLSTGLNRTLRELREELGAPSHMQRRLSGVDLLESPDESAARGAWCPRRSGPATSPALAGLLDGVEGLSGLGVEASRRLQWVHGSPHVEIPVLGLSLQVHVQSFFQANRFLFEPLAQRVLDLLPGTGPALDLYAGVGLFAVPLAARDGGEVVAVERAPTAVRDAQANARRHGWTGSGSCAGTSGRLSRALPAQQGSASSWTRPGPAWSATSWTSWRSDGPRRSSTSRATRPRWAGTWSASRSAGSDPDTVEVFDLFPDTFHLETVVRLRPA